MGFWKHVSDNGFWKWYFKLQEISEEPLNEDERIMITAKNNETGEKREYGGLRLKSSGKQRH